MFRIAIPITNSTRQLLVDAEPADAGEAESASHGPNGNLSVGKLRVLIGREGCLSRHYTRTTLGSK
jgi:hypothetical protein